MVRKSNFQICKSSDWTSNQACQWLWQYIFARRQVQYAGIQVSATQMVPKFFKNDWTQIVSL